MLIKWQPYQQATLQKHTVKLQLRFVVLLYADMVQEH